ncbi:hypothetical protein D3C75_1313310 [compost metagenome]
MLDGLLDVLDAECQMAQATGFRTTDTSRGGREGKQFDAVLAVECQIGLPGVTFFAVKLAE